MTIEETRTEAIERDGFFKTALIAYTANCLAHQPKVPTDVMVLRCAAVAEMTWEALLAYRKKYGRVG